MEGFSPNISDMIYYLVYCNDDLESFMLFPINRKDFWGVYADAKSIYYSLEFENETIKRINISDKTSYSYTDCFPGGVDIFSYNGEPYFNYTDKGITTTYKLLENTIEICSYFISDIPKKEIIF
ncbi:MAG: hypothetical protein GX612_08960 [Bacteroidales bacterium]|nr:hypothetical protein [Bacteroidales bacterium]